MSVFSLIAVKLLFSALQVLHKGLLYLGQLGYFPKPATRRAEMHLKVMKQQLSFNS